MTAPPPTMRSRRKKIVVSTETISTQNMTGFLTSVRGSSLRNDARIAGMISERSNSDSGLHLPLVERAARSRRRDR